MRKGHALADVCADDRSMQSALPLPRQRSKCQSFELQSPALPARPAYAFALTLSVGYKQHLSRCLRRAMEGDDGGRAHSFTNCRVVASGLLSHLSVHATKAASPLLVVGSIYSLEARNARKRVFAKGLIPDPFILDPTTFPLFASEAGRWNRDKTSVG